MIRLDKNLFISEINHGGNETKSNLSITDDNLKNNYTPTLNACDNQNIVNQPIEFTDAIARPTGSTIGRDEPEQNRLLKEMYEHLLLEVNIKFVDLFDDKEIDKYYDIIIKNPKYNGNNKSDVLKLNNLIDKIIKYQQQIEQLIDSNNTINKISANKDATIDTLAERLQSNSSNMRNILSDVTIENLNNIINELRKIINENNKFKNDRKKLIKKLSNINFIDLTMDNYNENLQQLNYLLDFINKYI